MVEASNNRHVITAAIASTVLVVVMAFYWDRQQERNYQQTHMAMKQKVMEELSVEGRRAQSKWPGFKPQMVVFKHNVSYKNIVRRIVPSIVSVNTSSRGNQTIKVQQAGRGGQNGADQGQAAVRSAAQQSTPQSGMSGAGSAKYVQQPQADRADVPGPGPPAPQEVHRIQPIAAQQGKPNDQFQALGRGGSGIIVSSRGYVLSSHHVVHGATDITVTLTSGRVTKTYPARIVDEARKVDLVILEIITKGKEVFPAAPIGDSSQVSVGDEVLSMGSPFGLQQSVTFGIISNTKRTLQVDGTVFTDIIQTDAPMNPGSSGGALIDINGDVIGINTAIYSPTHAFSGIGFAIPINYAKEVFPEFIETGGRALERIKGVLPGILQPHARQVGQAQSGPGAYPSGAKGAQVWTVAAGANKPWLGIRGSTLDSTIKASEGLPMARGVFVEEVFLNSSAWDAGLQSGDVILRVNNRAVKDAVKIGGLLAVVKPGEKIKLTVFRDGKSMVFYPVRGGVSTADSKGVNIPRGQAAAFRNQPFDPDNVVPPGLTGVLKGGELGVGEMEALGMGVETLAPEWRLAFKIPDSVTYGVIVSETGGLAGDAGILPGDVIQTINNQPIRDIFDYIKVMGKADLATGIFFGINRQGHRFSLVMKG